MEQCTHRYMARGVLRPGPKSFDCRLDFHLTAPQVCGSSEVGVCDVLPRVTMISLHSISFSFWQGWGISRGSLLI